MDIKKVMEKLVSIASEAYTLDQSLLQHGYTGSPYWTIFCNASDVIYHLIEEKTEDFSDSLTWKIFDNDTLTDEERVRILVQAYAIRKKNRPAHF